MTTENLKGVGVDLSMVIAFLSTLLPVLQGVIGLAIGVVILLINLKRYKKIDNEKKKD
jgi:hypothetical protein